MQQEQTFGITCQVLHGCCVIQWLFVSISVDLVAVYWLHSSLDYVISSAYAWFLRLSCLWVIFDLYSCSKLLTHFLFQPHVHPPHEKGMSYHFFSHSSAIYNSQVISQALCGCCVRSAPPSPNSSSLGQDGGVSDESQTLSVACLQNGIVFSPFCLANCNWIWRWEWARLLLRNTIIFLSYSIIPSFSNQLSHSWGWCWQLSTDNWLDTYRTGAILGQGHY